LAKHNDKACIECGTEFGFKPEDRPKACPNCGALYWWNPQDERVLFLEQEKFLESGRDPSALSGIYQPLLRYSENLIKNKMRNKFFVDPDYIEQKSDEVAIKVIERYLSQPDFKIETSFGGLMSKLVLGVLWGKSRKLDREESLNQKIYQGDLELQNRIFGQVKDSLTSQFQDQKIEKVLDSEEDLLGDLRIIVDKIYERVWEPRSSDNLLFLLGLQFFLEKKNSDFQKSFFGLAGSRTRKNVESTKLVLRNYLISLIPKERNYYV